MKNIAIIGLGIMGKNHYNILKQLPNINIVSLCDIDNTTNYQEPFYTNIDDMLKKEKIDAAIIAAPTFLHKEIAIKCIKYNIDLFIEKPVASSVQEALELNNIIKNSNIKSCVGHIERFNPAIKALIKEIADKEILSVSITRNGPFPQRISDVGILTDLSVHDTDLIRFITKKDIVKSSIFSSQKIHKTHEDNAVLSFILEGDILASISTSWLTPYKKRVVEIAYRETPQSNIKYIKANLLTQTLTLYNSQTDAKEYSVPKTNALQEELNEFITYISTGDKGNLASVEDSIITLEIANDS